jgi:2-C-methyl-D-erythritol 4-phosphate cytidylyltransferase
MSDVIAVLLAAGLGERFGGSLPKAFSSLGDKSIVNRSLETLRHVPAIKHIVVTVPDSKYIQLLDSDIRTYPVTGGPSRAHSVALALDHIEHLNLAGDYILIHDGARCFVSTDLIKRCIEGAIKHLAVTAATPAVDSMVVGGDENTTVEYYLPRPILWNIQTPQVFRRDIIFEGYKRFTGNLKDALDDASLVLPFQKVHLVLGEGSNRKITFKEDLE